eukprot:1277437-Rhodomonas_salina.1
MTLGVRRSGCARLGLGDDDVDAADQELRPDAAVSRQCEGGWERRAVGPETRPDGLYRSGSLWSYAFATRCPVLTVHTAVPGPWVCHSRPSARRTSRHQVCTYARSRQCPALTPRVALRVQSANDAGLHYPPLEFRLTTQVHAALVAADMGR